MVTTRGKHYHLRFYPFPSVLIGVSTPARTKKEAANIEEAILLACKNQDYRVLDPVSREVCVRMFRNQNWEIPDDLSGAPERRPTETLTLWKAAEHFMKYPEIKSSPGKWRFESALIHLVEKLGKDTPIKSVWVPELKTYQIERLNDKAAPDTVNRELSTLSRIFNVLIEMRLVDTNPARLVKRLSAKSGERQVYLAFPDVSRIMEECPEWFRPIVLTAYYTGMRRGEILGLIRKQVNLAKRMITLAPPDTKEAHWKRIPIHRDLVSILDEAQKVTCLGTEEVFLLKDAKGVRPLELETFKNPWPRACESLEAKELLTKPFPRFHDLRATWKTNSRRSGMDSEIREAILGHSQRGKSVTERYGRISDQELIQAIDRMTFDHGQTEIFVAWRSDKKGHVQNVYKPSLHKENQEVPVKLSS
jgi:integrase